MIERTRYDIRRPGSCCLPSQRSSRRQAGSVPALPFIVFAALIALVAPSATVLADGDSDPGRDWPQFRGAERNGISAGSGLLEQWPDDGPKELWRRDMGSGFSGVAVAGGAVYALFGDAEKEYAARFDGATGEEVWRTEIGPLFEEQFGNGPRSTPTVDGDRLFAMSSTGLLSSLDLGSGETVWTTDLQELGGRLLTRAFCPSPLVLGDLVVLETGAGEGKGIIAFDRATGETKWTAGDSRGGYSSPIAVEIDGVEQIVFVHSSAPLVSAVLRDGTPHWQHEWAPGTIAMPVFVPPNRILVSASADVGAMLIEIHEGDDGPTVEEVWRNKLMKNHFSSSVYLDGHVYGFDNGTLRCIDAATGESKWAKRGLGKGSLIAAEGRLYVLSDRGKMVLVEATPEEYRELGAQQVFRSRTWTAPALAAGKLFLRDHKELVCLEVGRG